MNGQQVGAIFYDASIDTKGFARDAKNVENSAEGIGNKSEKVSKRSNAAFTAIGKVGLAAVAAAAIAVGVLITKNIGNAVRRVDTLNNFPKVMANLGYEAGESSKAINKLDMGVRGLPTSLDSIASALQNIAPSSKSLGEATDLTLALNNALIAGNKPAEMQATAMEQFSQAIAKGKPDLMEWRSLATAMPGQMKQLSNSLGYKNWQELATAVTDGVIPFKNVTDEIVKLNKKGLGKFPSFADQAKNSAGGLQTGVANMNTAITRGIGNVIKAVGTDEISKSMGSIGKSFENASKFIISLIGFMKDNKNVFVPLTITLSTFVGAMTAWFVATKLVTASQVVLNAVMNANPIGLVIVSVLALAAGFMWLWNNVEGFRKFFIGAWENIRSAVATSIKFIQDSWSTISSKATEIFESVKSSIVDAFNSVKDTADEVFKAVGEWLDKNKNKIENIAIVIGTLLLPKLTAIGIEAGKAVVKSIAAFVQMSASAIINAVLTSAAWITSAALSSYAWVTQTLPKILIGFAQMALQATINALKVSASFILSSLATLGGWALTFIAMVAGFILIGIQGIIAAGKVAAAWLLAMGPIGLIIALVIGATALIINNWSMVKNWLSSFWGWLKQTAGNAWHGIQNVFRGVGAWFTNVFNGARNGIINAFNGIKRTIGAVWDWIKGTFSTIGGIATASIKGVINGVLGFAERTVNGFIKLINKALGAINKIPGVNIGEVGTVSLPRLAKGGVIPATPGGRLAVIGEGGEDEAVIPLSKLDKLIGNNRDSTSNNITINLSLSGIMTGSKADERNIAKRLVGALNQELKSKGIEQIGVA